MSDSVVPKAGELWVWTLSTDGLLANSSWIVLTVGHEYMPVVIHKHEMFLVVACNVELGGAAKDARNSTLHLTMTLKDPEEWHVILVRDKLAWMQNELFRWAELQR